MSHNSEGKPVLKWETLNTVREEHGLIDSRYIAELAKVPGGWLVIAQFKIGPWLGRSFAADASRPGVRFWPGQAGRPRRSFRGCCRMPSRAPRGRP